MKSILHRDFRYVHSSKTDVSKTIKREQARLKAQAELDAANKAEAQVKVSTLRKATK